MSFIKSIPTIFLLCLVTLLSTGIGLCTDSPQLPRETQRDTLKELLGSTIDSMSPQEKPKVINQKEPTPEQDPTPASNPNPEQDSFEDPYFPEASEWDTYEYKFNDKGKLVKVTNTKPKKEAPKPPEPEASKSNPYASLETIGVVQTEPKDLISLDLRDIEIETLLHYVAKLENLNLVMSDKLNEDISITLSDVTWKEIFNAVLKPFNYHYTLDGKIIYVSKIKNNQANTPVAPQP